MSISLAKNVFGNMLRASFSKMSSFSYRAEKCPIISFFALALWATLAACFAVL